MCERAVIIPFPDGKKFAVSFVDDTDFATVENVGPVYDFLSSMDFRGTKTVWVTRQARTSAFRRDHERPLKGPAASGATLEDGGYLGFILDLRKKGFEIGLHNISAGNTYREEIIRGIEKFKQIFGAYPKLNAFHERNIENAYAGRYKLDFLPLRLLEIALERSEYMGHREDSPYFWGDILHDNIKYVRLPFHTIKWVNTIALNPSMPFHDKNRPYVNYWFSSSDGSSCERFKKLLSPENVERLSMENGACMIYTHFANGFVHGNGGKALDPEFVGTMINLRRYNAWWPTASEFLDRLLLCKTVVLEHKGHKISVHNQGNEPIEGLTIRLPAGQRAFWGELESNQYSWDGGRLIIKVIPARSTIAFNTDWHADYTSRLPGEISRIERTSIEVHNYVGLLKERLAQGPSSFLKFGS